MVGEDAPEDRVRDCRRAYIVRRRVRVRQAGEGGCGHGKSLLPEGESCAPLAKAGRPAQRRSEEHTSELQSLMRISYAVFCLKKKTRQIHSADSYACGRKRS